MKHSKEQVQAKIDTCKARLTVELEHAEAARAVVDTRKSLFLENEIRKKLHEEDRQQAGLQQAKYHAGSGKPVEEHERLKAQERREYLNAQENRKRDHFEKHELKPLQDDKETKMLKASKTNRDIYLLEAVLYARMKLKPHVHAQHEARLETHMSAEARE